MVLSGIITLMILIFQKIITRFATDAYLEEIVLFNERIINMITKSMGDIVVLYPIITVSNYHSA